MRVHRGARTIPAAGVVVALALGGGTAAPPAATAAKRCPTFTANFPGGKSFRAKATMVRGSLSCRSRSAIGRRFYRNWQTANSRNPQSFAPVGNGRRCSGGHAGSEGFCKKGRYQVSITNRS